MSDEARFIERADKLLEKGKPELALAELRAASERQPESDALLLKIADLAISIGQSQLATEPLRRLFAKAVEAKQMQQAATHFRRLQRLKALEPELVLRYAELLESTSRRDAAEAYRVAFHEFHSRTEPRRALEAISNSLRLDPRLEDYREQGRIAEALHERVLAASALVHLGVMLERLGQSAAEAYARAYANDPNNLAARLGHGRGLIANQRPAEAIELLKPLATYPSSPQEAREPYALALLAVGRIEEAEPYVWGIFERDPAANLEMIHAVIRGLLERQRVEPAVGLARRLEEFFRKAGRRSEFMNDMARLAETSSPAVLFLEYLAELYNSANREVDYSRMLAGLFDLYFEAGNHAKALDALDRAVDIDPYEADHEKRMQKLAGHVADERLQMLARRLGVEAPEAVMVSAEELPPASVEPAPRVFQDLLLQAEIFLQYGMRDKALQKIEQMKQSFAAEMEGDARVGQLLLNAGVAMAPASSSSERKRPEDALARAAEVGRLIARQNDPRAVLVTAVNQIGSRWQYSRCLAALATPGKPPSLVVEYCAPDVPRSERQAMVRLLALSQRLVSAEPLFRAADVRLSQPLVPIRSELERLDIESLLVLALMNGDEVLGVLIVEQCGARRRWSPEDVEVLRSLADQLAQAVNGARLRSLVSTLGVAEEKTGLLKRTAYLDAVVADLSRQRTAAASTSSLALVRVADPTHNELQTELAVAELVQTLRSVAQDQAMLFRYDRETVAMLLPHMDSAASRGLMTQLRELLDGMALAVTAAVAEAGEAALSWDAEDAATEWINRVDRALSLAAAAPERFCSLPPEPASRS